MNELTIYPADLARMTVDHLVALPVVQLHEVERNIDEGIEFLKLERTKMDTAKLQRFGERARQALHESGRDFGTAHINDGQLHVKFELPKKVSWDQKKLKAIAERIAASGEALESYLDVKLSVPESRYTNWPSALQQQFADARTVEAGKPSFQLSYDLEA